MALVPAASRRSRKPGSVQARATTLAPLWGPTSRSYSSTTASIASAATRPFSASNASRARARRATCESGRGWWWSWPCSVTRPPPGSSPTDPAPPSTAAPRLRPTAPRNRRRPHRRAPPPPPAPPPPRAGEQPGPCRRLHRDYLFQPQPLDHSCGLIWVPVRRRFRPAGGEALHHLLHLAGHDRPLAQHPLLDAPHPALIVGGRQVVDRVHFLDGRAVARPCLQTLQIHQLDQGEDAHLPALVVRRLATRRDHRAEPVHAAQIVDAVHQRQL